jgi:hypothetical protein
MIDLGDAGSNEPFLTHLLRGCLLFESLLKENPSDPVTSKTSDLEALLRRLGKHLGVKGTISHLALTSMCLFALSKTRSHCIQLYWARLGRGICFPTVSFGKPSPSIDGPMICWPTTLRHPASTPSRACMCRRNDVPTSQRHIDVRDGTLCPSMFRLPLPLRARGGLFCQAAGRRIPTAA